MLLAADAGATKTLVGLFAEQDPRPRLIELRAFDTGSYRDLTAMVADLLAGARTPVGALSAACAGVAGPVSGTTASLTNASWTADAVELSRAFSIGRVVLLNDLEAMAHAVPVLDPSELAVLQEGAPGARGHAALIAAGTGLGEAFLHWIDGRYVPAPSEGGHADFAARTPTEVRLLERLREQYGRVDVERVVSGRGLVHIHRLLHTEPCPAVPASVEAAALPAQISAAALERRCRQCVETLEVFVSAYGAEAGNLALRSVARGGVFVGGGIAPKILPALTSGAFMDAFRAKPPMEEFLSQIRVSVILDERAGLLGAAVRAQALAREQQ